MIDNNVKCYVITRIYYDNDVYSIRSFTTWKIIGTSCGVAVSALSGSQLATMFWPLFLSFFLSPPPHTDYSVIFSVVYFFLKQECLHQKNLKQKLIGATINLGVVDNWPFLGPLTASFDFLEDAVSQAVSESPRSVHKCMRMSRKCAHSR